MELGWKVRKLLAVGCCTCTSDSQHASAFPYDFFFKIILDVHFFLVCTCSTMTASTRTRKTPVSYNLADVYKDLDSDGEAEPELDDDDSDKDEEFTLEDSGNKDQEGGGNASGANEDEDDELYSDTESEDQLEDQDEEVNGDEEERLQVGQEEDGEDEEDDDEEEDNDNDEIEAGEGASGAKSKKKRKNPRPKQPPRITRRPGLPAKSNSKRERIETIYGNDAGALILGIKARDLWIMDPVIPLRKSLAFSPFFSKEVLEIVDLGEGGQKSQWLDYEAEKESIGKHLPEEGSKIRCILGPLGGQKVITFGRFGICDVGTVHKGRAAHMINAGGHVTGLDWAPNRPQGFQYLAISVKGPIPPGEAERNSEFPPAYRRITGPGHIQIWRVPSSSKGTIAGKPSLAIILCHFWGNVRSLRWCPIPRKLEDIKELGYLAMVCGDGVVRVIKAAFQEEDIGEDTSFIKITEPLFEGRVPDTLCTCVTWMSTHEVAAGCANGFAVVWDIQHHTAPESRGKVIPPHHYLMLHQTYILDISSCFPSYPRTICTSSMDGHCRLTSLDDPQADTILTGRSRLSSNACVWVDCIQTVMASEDGTWVKMYPFRRFWSSTSVARQSQGGVILDLAGSQCHPFVLAAGGEGEVVVFNPLRKTFHGKIKVYQQTWFQLEYSPQSDMYRIMEGFRMEKISFKFETKGSKGDGHSTVFEERGGVTKVCWNGNPEFGGWAAAGSAGGLVRVEDLAYD